MNTIDFIVLSVLWSGLVIWGYLINLKPGIGKFNIWQSKHANVLSKVRGKNKSPKILMSLWNLFHVYIYICISFTLLLWSPQRWIEIMVGLLILSVVFEIIEIPFRQQDWTDVIYNFVGILGGTFIYYKIQREQANDYQWTAWLLFILLILGVFWMWRILRDSRKSS